MKTYRKGMLFQESVVYKQLHLRYCQETVYIELCHWAMVKKKNEQKGLLKRSCFQKQCVRILVSYLEHNFCVLMSSIIEQSNFRQITLFSYFFFLVSFCVLVLFFLAVTSTLRKYHIC